MDQPVNVLIMVHGMVIDREPSDFAPIYDAFWEKLQASRPILSEKINKFIKVQWGHTLPGQTEESVSVRPDQQLTQAEKFIGDNVNYAVVKKTPGPNNVVLGGLSGLFEDVKNGLPWFPVLRGFLSDIKERVFLLGFSDALYYSAPDGERLVRKVVYEQILGQLEEFSDAAEVRLHLFGHSMGVTLTHDFLYGLFGTDSPDFMYQGTERGVELFKKWKIKEKNHELKLGSLSSAASQLPLFMMRKKELVERYYQGQRLDPVAIGIPAGSRTRWKLFYDADDVLGYPSRNLYWPNDAIKEMQVGTGAAPEQAHDGYWHSQKVIDEVAQLIEENLKS